MSSDKNPEVVGCDASIMKNVWEIREREYGQKRQVEQERMQKSALSSINKDWENRLAVRMGKGTRVERKPKPVEHQLDSANVWKGKQPMAPPTAPRGVGSSPLGGPGVQKRSISTTAPSYKEKKVQDKNLNRLQLLIFIAQTNPSAMVWGKSWKFNKSLPPPEEGTSLDWGKCWMFATQQPYSEAGKPWLNGPNLMDPLRLHLWIKPDYRMVESQQLDSDLPTEEWQMSWIKCDENYKKGVTSSMNDENASKSRFFSLMVETQHRNEVLCSSEWSESWRSTKPSEQDNFTVPTENIMSESTANKQHKDGEMISKWEECWKLINHHGGNNFKSPQVQKSYTPEWVDSWRAAVVNNHKNSDPSVKEDHSHTYDSHDQKKDLDLYKIMLVSKKYRDLYLQFCDEFSALSEWSKSWQLTKNNSKPCEEIEKLLKVLSSRKETAFEGQKVEQKSKPQYLTSEKTDPRYEQLKHDVIYHPRREFIRSNLLHLMQLKNVLSDSEWRDSWKILKHRMRMVRRRMRPDPSRPFKGSEEGEMKPSASEWKDSWKHNCGLLQQEPELWQQGWTTIPQIRVDRARDENHFAPVQLPKNGPQSERSWIDSWRFSRPRHGSEPGQGRAETSQGRSNVASNYPDNSQTQWSGRHRGHARSVSDWQEAWMVSETQFHHDLPSLTQWRNAWKWSVFSSEQWAEQLSRESEMNVLMESQPQRERMSFVRTKASISRSFDDQIFRERYPEKQWSASWRAGSLSNAQQSQCSSSAKPEKGMSSSNQQHHFSDNGHGSKWGLSFRIANPMPKVEQPWVESSPNSSHYKVMWSREIKIQNNVNTNWLKQFNNAAAFRLWENSFQFLQGARAQSKDKTMSMEPVDPMVIMMKKIHTRRHLYSDIEQKKLDSKLQGCHLLSKTQPRPKKDPASVKKLAMEDESDDKFFEKWAGSWRSFFKPGSLKKQMPVKSLSGWNDSWKFLIPLYQPMNGPKAK